MNRRDGDYDEEIREHIEIETRENLARGMSPAEARRTAERAFGNRTVVRQNLREGGAWYWLESLAQDIRYGARLLTRNPLLSFSIVATLTLGIGTNAGVFTMLNAILLRPAAGEGFFKVLPAFTLRDGSMRHDVTNADYLAMRESAKTVGLLSARHGGNWTLGEDDPAPVRGMVVTCNYFAVYNLLNAKLGRLFEPGECAAPGAGAVVVMSEEMWRDRFGADPDIVGREVRVNRQPLTVVGVTPAGFAGNRGQGHMWIPYTMQPLLENDDPFRSGTPWLQVEGRFAPGATRAAVQSELRAIATRLDAQYSGRTNALLITNGTEIDDPRNRTGALLGFAAIMTGMTMILMIACINVSTLLLSRAAARQHEIAVRLSLGAGPGRILRMLLAENLILSAIAGVCSLWMTLRIPPFIERMLTGLNRLDLSPDYRVFAYLFAAIVSAGILAGFAPAAEALKVDISGALKGLTGIFGGRRSRTRTILVGTQVALSAILLTCAALMMRGQQAAFATDPGFNTTHVLADFINRPPNSPAPEIFYRVIEDRVARLAGVQATAWSEVVRGTDESRITLPDRPGQPPRPAFSNAVTPGYFAVMDIAIVRGQVPNIGAGAMVSEKFADIFWPGENPIGRAVQVGDAPPLTVAGVVRNTKVGLFGEADAAQIYPLRATGSAGNALMVRFSGTEAEVKRAMRREIYAIDARIASAPSTLQYIFDRDAVPFTRLFQMVLFLGAVATLMVVVGIYGVAAFSVRQRKRELGIRVALGANKREVVRLVMVSGTRPVLAGLAIGMLFAIAAATPLAQAFHRSALTLRPHDPLPFVAAAVVLVTAACAAMFGPALRASGADAVKSLRQE